MTVKTMKQHSHIHHRACQPHLAGDAHGDGQLALDSTVVVNPVAVEHHQHQLHAGTAPQAGHALLGTLILQAVAGTWRNRQLIRDRSKRKGR